MRNLRTTFLHEDHLRGKLPLTATAWDTNNNSIVCAFGPTKSDPVIELKRRIIGDSVTNCAANDHESDFTLITSWDAPCPLPDLTHDEVLLLQYFPDISAACLVLAGGDLVIVREQPYPGQEKIEIVGSVDVGIAASAWAPDEELLAIVTRADTLILMSRDFEPVTEVTFTSDDLKASKHVSVGWGKKETQFHGKRAKALRDPTIPENIDEGRLSPCDDARVSISWRGDGAFLAVNSVVNGFRRVIRVFTREAILDSVSEPVDGLESALSWRPDGNLIASIQRLDDRLDVVFFERNGLRHGEFSLRISKDDMNSWCQRSSLSWNMDSSVLAVSFQDRVQLWTMGNYHHYLKQEICGSSGSRSETSAAFRWHAEKLYRCSVFTTSSLLELEYAFIVCRGSTVEPYDHGIVAVIDGKNLKLTAFKHAAVPPPMAFLELNAKKNITDCSISSTGQYLAVLSVSSLEVYEWEYDFVSPSVPGGNNARKSLKPSSRIARVSIHDLKETNDSAACSRFTRVEFRGETEAIVLAPGQAGIAALLKAVNIQDGKITNIGTSADGEALLIENIITDTQHESVWGVTGDECYAVAYNSEVIARPSASSGGSPPSTLYRLSNKCKECKAPLDSVDDSQLESSCSHFHTVALSPKGNLKIGVRTVARGCTSCVATDTHLIFTTRQHLLKVIHLTSPEAVDVPGDTPEIDERCRSIERGARLVTVVPATFSVTLQMPRGNLETIYPRVLVLAGIRKHITGLNLKTAFIACQTHQVDMNILHDYNPDLFMDNIPRFIEQVKKVSRIDEFLSKLKDEDVSQTIYRDTLEVTSADINDLQPSSDKQSGALVNKKAEEALPGKVNRICDAFIAALSSMQSPPHLQNIITAHVSKRPPDLKSALTMVSSLRQSSPSSADSTISHLCFLSDTTRLYDTALSLYDLELALLVAQNSQRDPREYLPFLQTLNSLPALRRQYTIDNYLKNHGKALGSLHELQEHDEVEAYTIKHGLYRKALDLYRYDPLHFKSVTALHASHLASLSQHAAAATLYESLGDYTAAYPLHALAHHWREALTCAALVPLPADQLNSLATSLATTCADETRDYRAAAVIHNDYLNDITTAARLYCKGSYFADASRILALHGMRDEMTLVLDTGLTEKFGEILELLADCKGQLNAQIPRIRELRQKKEEDPLAFYGGDPITLLLNGDHGREVLDIPDNISLAPTDATTTGGQSLFTRYGSNASKFGGTVASNMSHKTSKTKRREERKRARGKKGSVYEEEYLVASVRRLIERVNGVQDEVQRLLAGLLRRGAIEGRDRAAAVDEKMREMVRACQDAKREIWGLADEETPLAVDEQDRPGGADGVLWDSRAEMNGLAAGSKGKAPEVRDWIGPDLLVG